MRFVLGSVKANQGTYELIIDVQEKGSFLISRRVDDDTEYTTENTIRYYPRELRVGTDVNQYLLGEYLIKTLE